MVIFVLCVFIRDTFKDFTHINANIFIAESPW